MIMTSFMDRITESERWIGRVQHGLDVLSEGLPGDDASVLDKPAARPSRDAILSSIVEGEILPRLARIRRNAAPAAPDARPTTTRHDSEAFIHLLLTQDAAAAVAFIDALRRNGVTPASLYLGIVANAAHRLGDLWQEDRCGFDQVAISMGRLQIVLRSLSPHFQMEALRPARTDSVLLAPAPGEQHTFGLLMLAEFFRREGWHVAGGPVMSAKDVVGIVRNSWIDVVGFSIGSAGMLDGLADCVRRVRRASCNAGLCVMVGGPLFLMRPDLVESLGADMVASDAAEAVRQARGLLAIRTASAD
jgi:methanogenic corrinoid protein MtbC1